MAGEIQGQPIGSPSGGPRAGRTYSEEDVMALMNEAAKRAATETMKNAINANKRNDDEEEANESVINPKIVKQLKDTVAVFTALKELSSNPLQNTIEETVGTMAASVIQNAFAPRGPPPKRDLMDTILNSQFAYGLGSGLGQRAPELVETMGRTFGPDKTGQMINDVLGKYGSPGGQGGQSSAQSRQIGPGTNQNPSPASPPQEQKTDKQSEKELLLSLDPNNPEHVSAYAETQGGLPIEVARKMLMIHQDAFIEQMKREGMNVEQISLQRGSRATPQQAPQQNPVANTSHTSSPVSNPQIITSNPHIVTPEAGIDNIQYEDRSNQSNDDKMINNELIEENQKMIKDFANDIGKIIGDMVNKIENLNNTVFTLQSELNTIKTENNRIPSDIPPMVPIHQIPTGVPSDGTPVVHSKPSEIFFDEKPQDIGDFMKELEEEQRIDNIRIENNELPPRITNNTPINNIPEIVNENQKIPPLVDIKDNIVPPIVIPESINKLDPEQNLETKTKPESHSEIKKFAHPINKAGIKRISPSFKKEEIENHNTQNKDVEKDMNVDDIEHNNQMNGKENNDLDKEA